MPASQTTFKHKLMSNSIPSNQPSGLPSSALPTTGKTTIPQPVPPVLLDQVDHLSALPLEMQYQIIDWLTPMQRLTADLGALATASKKMNEIVKNYRETHGSDPETLSLHRCESALRFLSGADSGCKSAILRSAEETTMILQPLSQQKNSISRLFMDKSYCLTEGELEQALAAFHNYQGRPLYIEIEKSDDKSLQKLKRIVEVFSNKVPLEVCFRLKKINPSPLKKLFDAIQQRIGPTSLTLLFPEKMCLETQKLLWDFTSSKNPASTLAMHFFNNDNNRLDNFIDALATSLPNFGHLPLMYCQFTFDPPSKDSLNRLISAVTKRNQLESPRLTVIFCYQFNDSNNNESVDNTYFSSQKTQESLKHAGIYCDSLVNVMLHKSPLFKEAAKSMMIARSLEPLTTSLNAKKSENVIAPTIDPASDSDSFIVSSEDETSYEGEKDFSDSESEI